MLVVAVTMLVKGIELAVGPTMMFEVNVLELVNAIEVGVACTGELEELGVTV